MKSEIKIILLLFCVSAILLLLHSVALNRSLIIDLDGDIPIYALDDKSIGGTSEAVTYMENGRRILECELKTTYQYPFCELNFQLTTMVQNEPVRGIDFTNFTRVGLWLKYTAPVDAGIRLHLRNFNPEYASLADENSLKYNSLEWFKGQGTTEPIWIPLDSLQVSTWWLSENQVSLKNSGPELNNIVTLELATGTKVRDGFYRMEVEKIEFQGKLLSKEQLYLILVSMWMLFAFLRLGYSVIKYNKTLVFFKFREQELTTINHLLDSKSRALEDQVGRDVLTGILNRQGLQAILFNDDSTISRAKGLSIAFIDIDHFKQVNDKFGHTVGDEVLKEFARLIEDNIRNSSEIIARWGGEEFILACPNSNLKQVELLAEKIRLLVATHHWPQNIGLTCSIGVAQMSDESIESFIKRADVALYAAKNQGRNRVVSATK